jgi:hypothetical protein
MDLLGRGRFQGSVRSSLRVRTFFDVRRSRFTCFSIPFVLAATLLSGCGDKIPVNFEEYNKAYGIIPGQSNDLRVGDVQFRFPPQYLPDSYAGGRNPYHSKGIVPGEAEMVTIHMDLSSWLGPPPNAFGEMLNLVRIEIRASGYEDDKKIEDYLKRGKWESVRDRPELGLREYVWERREKNDWFYFTYEPLDPIVKTPRGVRFIFICNGTSGKQLRDICHSGYQHFGGPFVSFYLGRPLLSHWKEVQEEVIKLVDSLIVH